MKKDLILDPVIEQMLKDYDNEQVEQIQDYLEHPQKLSVFMDFKVDYAFKFILGHKPILLKLINDILPVKVSNIEYLPNEIPVVSPKEKRAAFDVVCTASETGERFITEMQCLPDTDMDNRLLYYGCSLVHSQVKRGSDTYSVKPVYVLCVANYERNHGKDISPGQFFFGYQFREQAHPGDMFSDNLQYFFLELPRLKKIWDSLETNLERWCYLFGNLNTFVETPENPAGFDDVFEIARTEVLGGNELKKYVASMVDKYTIYTTTEYARREGHKEGVKEGMEKGIEKGREEGIAIGAKEKALEIAGKALAMGMPVEQVAELSGLPVEELKEALA